MHKLIWYRQKRFDGGIRTAVDVDDVLLLHRFENENYEPDPALLWYADLRCEGQRLPTKAETAQRWLLQRSDVIRQGFRDVAEELRAGMDVDAWPVMRKIRGFPDGVKAVIAFAAARRLDGVAMADVLIDVADHWDKRIPSLATVESARTSRRA
jgi:hypothetical protein